MLDQNAIGILIKSRLRRYFTFEYKNYTSCCIPYFVCVDYFTVHIPHIARCEHFCTEAHISFG